MRRFDERDIPFARFAYDPESSVYEDYYKRHPQRLERDLHIRSLPQLCSEGTMTWNPMMSPVADAIFKFLGDINTFSEQAVARTAPLESTPELLTKKIKALARHLGIQDVGITRLKDEHLYTHRGRKPEHYGEPVHLEHSYAIAFTVEMDEDMIDRSPQLEEIIETSTGYLRAGIAGMILSYWLRELGYEARNHMDGNYLLVAPLVAQEAGLGEIGRMGLLTTRKSGPRVRLGVVTTTAILIPDAPDPFGLMEFCEICGKCQKTCPGKAIPAEKNAFYDGIHYWKIDHENCYERWRSLGTDCGICLSTCPFSHNISFPESGSFEGQTEAIEKALADAEEKYGMRRYIREPLDIMK